MQPLDFHERPILVFWEATRACLLACRHCRAEAMEQPLPGELSTEEALRFVASLASFGRPYPVLIMTGGDVLMRPDIFEIAAHARNLGIPVGMAPSVTPRLSDDRIARMREIGIKAVSVSLDGATADTHDRIRGVPGHFQQTVQALDKLAKADFSVQVNTTVMKDNVDDLPGIVDIMAQTGVSIWEVFFLIQVGRGRAAAELSAEECEAVAHFLFDASLYDLTVRTVEAPAFRRVAAWRKEGNQSDESGRVAQAYGLNPLYARLAGRLHDLLGDPMSHPKVQTSSTRDGKGIIFVAYDGTVHPAGFLPIPLGSVRGQSLADIYRHHPLLRDIRLAHFGGRCGVCEYRDACGGSRSRAYAHSGDALAEDPACGYAPGGRGGA